MSSGTIALVLVAAAANAGWNLLVKRVAAGPAFLLLTSVTSTILLAPIGVAALLAWDDRSWGRMGVAVLGTSLIHAAYFVMLQRGYRTGELSVVYPLARGTGPLLAAAGALVFLGERPGAVALVGGAAIVVGVLGLSGLTPSRLRPDQSMVYGVAVGAAIAAYTLWDRWSVVEVGVPPATYLWLFSAGYGVLIAPWLARDPAELRRTARVHWRVATAVTVGQAVSYLLILTILRRAPVSVVAPLREVSILMAAALGARYLGEAVTPRKLAAAGVILAGVALIAVG